MKRAVKKILSAMFALVTVLCLVPLSGFFGVVGSSETSENICGENLSWSFNSETDELEITGSGDMYDYDAYFPNLPPWVGFSASIKSVVIGDDVTSVGIWAFTECSAIKSVKIGKSVAAIGEFAFDDCSEISFIEVDENNEFYSNDANGILYNKSRTELIKYPVGNEKPNFTIPDGVMTVGAYAFRDSVNLTSVTINNSVAVIGEAAFVSCINLKSVSVPDSVISIGNCAFQECVALENIIIPDTLNEIGVGVFENCRSFTSVTIPDSVENIGYGAFLNCNNLTSITIGNGVTGIEDSAFYFCGKLTDVYYNGTQAQWNKIVIDDNNDALINADIHFADEIVPGISPNPDSTCIIKDNYIYGLKTNLTVTDLLNDYVVATGVTVDVSLAVTGRSVGTGSTVMATYPDGTTEILTVIIYGDMDGNGRINVADLNDFSAYFSTSEDITPVQKIAMNLDNDSKKRLTANDLLLLQVATSSGDEINQVNPAQ